MPAPLAVIINPCSGSSSGALAAQVRGALDEHGCVYGWHATTPQSGGRDLARQAVREGAGHIIVCGGDGTVMAVVNGIGAGHGSDVLLSIIPAGTANLLAAALGISTDPAAALAVALGGHSRVIDLGRCGDTLFALGLGLGLTERLVSQASAREKERLGKLAYAHAMLREMGARPGQFTFQLDDQPPQTQAGVAVVVANSGTIGGGLRFAPAARMDDGLLNLCVLHHFYPRDFPRLLLNSLLGRLRQDRALSFYQAKRICIDSQPPLDLQIDGEVVDQGVPLIAEAIPRALRVTVAKRDA